MKEYVLDVVENVTYSCTVEANSLEEAEEIARERYNNRQLDIIDVGIVAIDQVE